MKSNTTADNKGVKTLEEAKAVIAKIDKAKLRLNSRMLAHKINTKKSTSG